MVAVIVILVVIGMLADGYIKRHEKKEKLAAIEKTLADGLVSKVDLIERVKSEVLEIYCVGMTAGDLKIYVLNLLNQIESEER